MYSPATFDVIFRGLRFDLMTFLLPQYSHDNAPGAKGDPHPEHCNTSSCAILHLFLFHQFTVFPFRRLYIVPVARIGFGHQRSHDQPDESQNYDGRNVEFQRHE